MSGIAVERPVSSHSPSMASNRRRKTTPKKKIKLELDEAQALKFLQWSEKEPEGMGSVLRALKEELRCEEEETLSKTWVPLLGLASVFS